MSVQPSLRKRFVAEIFGTFFLVFIGTLAITAPSYQGLSTLTVGLAFGVGALGAAYSFGHVSGAHINPAVTTALAVRGKFPWREAIPYVVAQLIGAIFAALLNASIVGRDQGTRQYLGATYPNQNLSLVGVNATLSALLCEIVITFILVLTIISVNEKEAPGGFGGLVWSFVLGLNVTIAATISGGSMNPARTFGPQLVLFLLGSPINEAFESFWIYWVGPLIGGLLAALVHWIKS